MAILKSNIHPQQAGYQENYQKMQALVADMEEKLVQSRFQGADKHIAAARKQGKLLARERIALVLDPDSPFLELMPLAGLEVKDAVAVGGTSVGGIGVVSGHLAMIIANVGTNKGGTVDYITLQKSMRLAEIARENRLPTITFVESGGANLPEQAKIFNQGGASFREITQRSQEGIPSIAIVTGNATAGGAYIPGMSDYAIFVRNNAKVFLAGPPLVKMATGEESDDESLGGAAMHSEVSGVSDYLAEDEYHAIRLARELMSYLPVDPAAFRPDPATVKPPRYPAEELLGIVTADYRVPFEVRELLARVIDDSDFHEFKPSFAPTLVTGFARIHGYPVGVIANNGVLFSDSANKATQFIQLCDRQRIPILFLQNITGFMVGKKYEAEGIIKHGAKMINAVSNAKVPLLTLMIGASYGAGNYAMAGRSYNPRFLFSYPNAKIGVMGSEQLVGVMDIVQRASAAKAGKPYDEQKAQMMGAMLKQELEKQSTAYYATAHLWDDGLLAPTQTRDYLAICLAVVYSQTISSAGSYGIFRM
ncbi:acyl-CoA carboxylase subunit beta [Eisenibacter elegans]|uniref:acyl-CoA carboxylase subunit beta n=1 Tax=Eisenibacter elegans TaxID=997 RepID=UPI00042A5B65|nr:carboxyl transferase domain-containing protein [Eisenibacter elegans]